MPGRPKGPKTVVDRVRFEEEDYKVLKTCWHRHNPEDCHTFHAWIVNELHKMAEELRGFPTEATTMDMRFLVDYVPESADAEEIKPFPLLIEDALIRALVSERYLAANDATNPVKVLEAVQTLLKVALGVVTAQKVASTRQ